MKWLLKPFSREKTRNSQPSPDEKKQDFTGVLHILIEETILAVAQWLISFTKQMLESTMAAPNQITDAPVSDASTAENSTSLDRSENASVSNEGLSQEIESLIQQLQQANQQTHILEERIIHLEKLLAKYSVIPKILKQQQSAIAALQRRIPELETPYQNNHHTPTLQLSHLEN